MRKLMKYEFRKTRFTRSILLLIAVISEILFLTGLFLEWDNGAIWGAVILMLDFTFGIIYIGIESILTLSKDLNTKQSYMLFLTPKNSFQILGAKALENLISIIVAGALFALLFLADFSAVRMRYGELDTFLQNFNLIMTSMFESFPTWQEIVLSAVESLLQWFMTITIGYLAVVLSSTLLAGKRLNALISFLLFILLLWASAFVLDFVLTNIVSEAAYYIQTVLIFLISAGFYFLSGWILERKMSL